jgi:hypothetical protein
VVNSTWIDISFPKLKKAGYKVTSLTDDVYNCIAWAAGDRTTWWSYADGYYWPIADHSNGVQNLINVFESIGFQRCENNQVEANYDKVAIFAKAGIWKHAARQLADGRWASKLGPDEDIEHVTLESLEGDVYGVVFCTMRKARI